MPTVKKSIEVDVPVRIAYDQWTQFEEFPKFMEGVEHVQQKDDTHLHWVASIGGHKEEWDAKITEQIPDQKVAWKATTGKGNAGIVTSSRSPETRRASPSRWTGTPRASPRRRAAPSVSTATASRATSIASRR